jgi:uncharacterized protein involved in outer membrane biogenesis
MLACAELSCSWCVRAGGHNGGMTRWMKWVLLALAIVVLGIAAVGGALQYWLASGDLRQRIEREASSALGVPLRLGAVSVDLWPLPAVAFDHVAIGSQPAVTLDRVEARPRVAALMAGRLEIATLVVRKAVVPQQAVQLVSAAMLKKNARSTASSAASPPERGKAWWPRRAQLDEVTWVDTKGATITVDASVDLAEDGLPAAGTLKVRRGRFAGARVTLKREGAPWSLRAELGGGRVAGKLTLQPGRPGQPALLQGSFDTSNVEIAFLTAPSRTLTGRIDAKTTLRAHLRDIGGLAEAAQTQTQFTVRNPVIHGVDLRVAVQTIGLSRGGDTALDALAGRLATQGKAAHLTNLVATAGGLSATGDVAMTAAKALSGRINVDLTGGRSNGAIAIPLVVGGTLDDPSVTLTRGALIGAAIGTIVMPGVGTGAGATLGDRIGTGLRGLFRR